MSQSETQSNQMVNEAALSEIGSAARETFDSLIAKVNSRLIVPASLSCTGADTVVTVNGTKVTLPNGKTLAISQLASVDVGNVSGAIQFNAPGGAASVSGSFQPITLPAVAASNFLRVGFEIRTDKNIYAVVGAPAATSAAAGAPAFSKTSFQCGEVLLQANGGATAFVTVTNSVLTQFGIGGSGGSGSGLGAKNYVSNSDAEIDVSGWNLYNDITDGGLSQPFNATGGSITNSVTLTRTTSTPDDGSGSFLLSVPAINSQGYGISTDLITFDNSDKFPLGKVEFDYVTSTNYATGDLRVFAYDITGATLLPVYNGNQNSQTGAIQGIVGAGNTGHFVGYFNPSAGSLIYRLAIHIASVNASGYTIKYDNVTVGPAVSTEKITRIIDQPVHGFSIGQMVTLNPATSQWITFSGVEYESGAYLVTRILNSSMFEITISGRFDGITGTIFNGLNPGDIVYFHSNSYSSVPVGQTDRPLFVIETAYSGYVIPWRPRTINLPSNYVINPDFEDDKVGNAPKNWTVTGAVPAVTSNTAGEIIRGTKTFKIGGTGAISGNTVDSSTFSLDAADLGGNIQYSFEYKTLSGFASGDFVYVVVDSGVEVVATQQNINISNTVTKVSFVYAPSTSSTGVKLRFKKVGNGITQMVVDSVSISPKVFLQSMSYQDTASVTGVVVTGFASNPTPVVKAGRHGDRIKMSVGFTTAGAAPTGFILVAVPATYAADTGKIVGRGGADTSQQVGVARLWDTNAGTPGAHIGIVELVSGNAAQFQIVGDDSTGAWNATNPIASTWTSSGIQISLELDYPVAAWSTNNVNLAQSFKEHLINSDTSSSSNTTSFSNSLAGVAFPIISSTGTLVTKRVQSSQNGGFDLNRNYVVQVIDPNGIAHDALRKFPWENIGGVQYGVDVNSVAGNILALDILFGAGGATPTAGDTWAAYSTAGWKWRVINTLGIGAGEVAQANSTTAGYLLPGAQTLGGPYGFTQNILPPQRTVSAATSITSADYLLACDTVAAAGAFSVTLPLANSVGSISQSFVCQIKDKTGAAGAKNVTVLVSGSDTIDGAASKIINSAYGSITVASDGSSKWMII